jgi:REP element-mobilizing transposase RayT
MHINFKYRATLRNKFCLRLLKKAILNSRKHGLRVIHFSLQSNHVHLIVEAESNALLTKGMRSLTVTFAKGLNKGKVQLERYHLHVLKSLRETRNAIQYVLFNKQKHEKGTYSVIDEYSSVLSMLEMIKEFAKKSRITLKMEKGEIWKGDTGRSYLIKKALIHEGH